MKRLAFLLASLAALVLGGGAMMKM